MEKTLKRETAIEALMALNSADALIGAKTGLRNQFRTEVIKKMQDELEVEVSISETRK